MATDTLTAGQRLLDHMVDLAPVAASGLMVVVIGAAAAWGGRRFVAALVRKSGLETLAESVGLVKFLYAMQIKEGLGSLLGRLTSLAIWLVTAMTLAEVLGLPGVAEGVATIVEFLPKVVAAAVVAGAGLAAADVTSRVVEGVASRREDLVAPKMLSAAVYYVVLAVFLSTAIQHIGIQTNIIDQLLILVVGLGLGTVGLSLALGSRDVVKDVIARQYGRQLIQVGDVVTIAGFRGKVVRFDALTVTVRSEDGDRIFPCRALLDPAGIQVDASRS